MKWVRAPWGFTMRDGGGQRLVTVTPQHGVDLAPGVVVRLDAAGHLMMGYRSVIPCFKPWAHIPLRDRCLLLVPMILSAAALSRRTYGGAEASR